MPGTTTARAMPSERVALWVPEKWPTQVPPLVVGGPPPRRHLSGPERRKSSMISRPFEAGLSFSHWTIFSMTTSKPPWRSAVSCPRNPCQLCWAGCHFQVPGMPEHPGTPPAPISLSGTAGPAACGEAGMSVRSGVAIRSGPTVPNVTSANVLNSPVDSRSVGGI